MATIYRFIIESQQGKSSGRSSSGAKKGAGKKGKWVSLFGGQKGGVEHNRKMRAINPLINKATGGVWEKGMRFGRAAKGLVKKKTVDGKTSYGVSGTAIAIIVAMAIQIVLKLLNQQRQIANSRNAQNFKQMEDGYNPIHGAYEVSTNFWTGERTYNENK